MQKAPAYLRLSVIRNSALRAATSTGLSRCILRPKDTQASAISGGIVSSTPGVSYLQLGRAGSSEAPGTAVGSEAPGRGRKFAAGSRDSHDKLVKGE